MYEDDFDYWMDDWSVEMYIEEAIIEKHERRRQEAIDRYKVCPGCGDPSGPCPNASCVRNDDPGLCDYKGNPLD